MKFRLIVKHNVVLPSGKSQCGVFARGVLAFKAGKPIEANPHELYSNGTYFYAWENGWKGAQAGDVDIEVLAAGRRMYGQEIVRV